MIRVVVTGSECTGKTTLAEGSRRITTEPIWVPEFARHVRAREGRSSRVYEDVNDDRPRPDRSWRASAHRHGLAPCSSRTLTC